MRCKSCDSVMEETDIVWYNDIEEHEELCSKCLKIIHDLETEGDIFDDSKFIDDFIGSLTLGGINKDG